MLEQIDHLDLAVESMLEKATTNTRAHLAAALHGQEDYDKHVDALAHHAGAIEHYRNKPAVKEALEHISKELVGARPYVNKSIKLENSNAPSISEEDLKREHPLLKGGRDLSSIVNAYNAHIKQAHTAIHSNPDLKALTGHSARFLAHLHALAELHGLEKEGKIPHAKFSANLHAPEITDRSARISDSEHRRHFHAGGGKYTTQSITKNGGAGFHPGLPELDALEEDAGHPSVGTPKKLYPFEKIKVNGEGLPVKSFSEKKPPELIHPADYATNLTKEHMVLAPGSSTPQKPIGGYNGSKSMSANMENMGNVGFIPKEEVKKSEDEARISSYFPETTIKHYTFAKHLLKVMNPFAVMTDEQFGDYVMSSMSKSGAQSEQAACLAECVDRMEKAEKKRGAKQAKHDAEHARGVADVLAGRVTPLPTSEAAARTTKRSDDPEAKTNEKHDELGDIARGGAGEEGFQRRRSPYAVPPEVFTDDTYSKIDPDKYKAYVNGDMKEQDLRNEHATYGQMIRHNPDAQARHKQFVENHRDLAQSGLAAATEGAKGDKVETPVADHAKTLQQAGADLASGKIDLAQHRKIMEEAAAARKKGVTGKVGSADLSDDEKKIREADPNYKPTKEGGERAAASHSQKDLTSIAGGKIPGHMLADPEMFGDASEHSGAQAKEFMSGKGAEGEGGAQLAGMSATPSPIQLINDHPGFKAYLQLKDHLLSHYKNPAVRKYMEDKINQHENNPNLDVPKLAATMSFLHRSQDQAAKAAGGREKLLADIASAKDGGDTGEDGPAGKGSALQPETMMSPEERTRMAEVKAAKPAQAAAPVAAPAAQPNAGGKVRTAKDMSPDELAAITARANKPKTTIR